MNKVEFFGLERPIQERFIESTRGTGAPAPLLLELPGPNLKALTWSGAALLLLILCVVFARIGYGDLEHALALTPAWGIAIFVALLAAATACGLRAGALFGADQRLPFRRGVYAFPSTAIDAREAALALYPLGNLADVVVRGRTVELRFNDGHKLRFTGVDPARAEEAKGQLLDYRERVSAPPSERGMREGLLDPLFDTGFKNPFSPPDRMRPTAPRWLRFAPLIAIGVGGALGYLVWHARNTWSAGRLYAEAVRLDSTDGYRNYLARGGAEKDVQDIRLPRAELRDAITKQSVPALEQFIATHPGSQIEQEIQAALRVELLRDLEEAKAKGTLTALRDFKKTHARHAMVAAELAGAERALFRSALDRFVAGAPEDSEELGPFVARLLTYAEKHGPKVELRFRRRMPESSLKAELAIQKSAYYAGPASLPVQFFGGEKFEPREASVASELASRFEKAFPKDMLRLEPSPALEDDGSELPKVTVPTLLITHRSNLSGAFMSRNPRGTFVGMGLTIRAALLIPEDPTPLTFKYTVWLPADIKKFEQGNVSFEAVYDGMAREAFRRFTKKYLATFFAQP